MSEPNRRATNPVSLFTDCLDQEVDKFEPRKFPPIQLKHYSITFCNMIASCVGHAKGKVESVLKQHTKWIDKQNNPERDADASSFDESSVEIVHEKLKPPDRQVLIRFCELLMNATLSTTIGCKTRPGSKPL